MNNGVSTYLLRIHITVAERSKKNFFLTEILDEKREFSRRKEIQRVSPGFYMLP